MFAFHVAFTGFCKLKKYIEKLLKPSVFSKKGYLSHLFFTHRTIDFSYNIVKQTVLYQIRFQIPKCCRFRCWLGLSIQVCLTFLSYFGLVYCYTSQSQASLFNIKFYMSESERMLADFFFKYPKENYGQCFIDKTKVSTY